MAWTQTEIDALILVAKGTSGNVAEAIANELSLGQWVSDSMYHLYTLEGCINALQKGGYGVDVPYTDNDYNTIAEIIDKIATVSVKN